jgi:hypothetical protein
MPTDADWIAQSLNRLDRSGPVGHATVRYMKDHRVRVSVRRQSAGARWTVGKTIELHPRYVDGPAASPYSMSLVVHEARHLQQGWLTALSVYGELDAWQHQFSFLESLVGPYREAADRGGTIARLMTLQLGWDRSALRRARELMQAFAGKGYRIDLLPLYPVHKELLYLFTGWSAANSP